MQIDSRFQLVLRDCYLQAGLNLFKDNIENTKAMCEICSKLVIKTPELRLKVFWCFQGV